MPTPTRIPASRKNLKKPDYQIGAVLIVIGLAIVAGAVALAAHRQWQLDGIVMGSAVGFVGLLLTGTGVFFVVIHPHLDNLKGK